MRVLVIMAWFLLQGVALGRKAVCRTAPVALCRAATLRSKPVFGAQTTHLNMRRLCVVQSDVWVYTNETARAADPRAHRPASD
ncbi:hypothetical protein GCM10010309_31600 [Streptomyces violaceochromogenes]|nr:hypothetical protein GCM10010309_31600 [Streptomyces violaceochromogenes]